MRRLFGLLLSVIAPIAAQEPCATCGDAGSLACRVCAADLEAAVVACSVGARCRACAGAAAVACAKCAAGARVESGLARQREAAGAWLREVSGLVSAAGITRAPIACRTAHFDLWFAPGPIDDCPAKDVHAQTHLYAERLEALRTRAVKALGLGEADVASDQSTTSRVTIAIFRDELDCARLTAHLAGLEVQGVGVVEPARRVAILLHDRRSMPDDAALQRRLAHALAHVVTAALPPVGRLTESGHGWLDEGIAHWLEAGQPGEVCENFCQLERLQAPRRCFGGRWRPGVRELLEGSLLPTLADLLGRPAADFEPRHHALAFALVDYLSQPTAAPNTPGPITSQRPLPRVLRAAKAGADAAEVLRAGTGLDLDALDARLRAWVKEAYPRR